MQIANPLPSCHVFQRLELLNHIFQLFYHLSWIFLHDIQNLETISKGNNFIFQISIQQVNPNISIFFSFIMVFCVQYSYFWDNFKGTMLYHSERAFEGQRLKVKPHNHRSKTCLYILKSAFPAVVCERHRRTQHQNLTFLRNGKLHVIIILICLL